MEFSKEKLLSLIALGESETLEFKESFGDDALETIGAFANASGGNLLIGVKDSGESSGFQVGKYTLEEIANRIQNLTDPRLQPSIITSKHEDKSVIVIQVPARTGTPVSVRGRYFRRVGKTTQRMSHEEIMQRLLAHSGLSWDACLEPSATLDELDMDLIKRFISTVKKLGRRPVPELSTEYEFLDKIGLIHGSVPTRAAILLLGKNPEMYFPSAFSKMGRFRTSTTIVDDRETHGALLKQLDDIIGWFRERLATEFAFNGKAERVVTWEYPLNAIREAVINVLCHRDYTCLAHSQFRLYDDRLEIWNSGSLPPPLTPEMLLKEHDSIPRNRKLAEAFFYMGLIERWGSGTTRILTELQEANHPIPKFESDAGRFRLTFYKKNTPEIPYQKTKLSKRQQLALNFIKENGSITNSEFQNLAAISSRTALRELNQLIMNGLITTSNKSGRGTSYILITP